MLTAARAGDVAALSAALERDPTLVGAGFWYMPPLHFAVREGHLDAVRLLVAAGADLTHRNALYGNDTLLQMAVDRGHERVADYLRRELRRRLASAGSRHPIHAALAAGDMAAVERLLGADRRLANRGDHLGRRPLHYAVEAGRRDLVDLLLGAGADIDTPGFGGDDRIGGSGFRPLVLALWHNPYWQQRNDHAMARHLLDRGAEYSITVAAALGDEARVEALLDGGAGAANRSEACGKRPLSAAAERGHEHIVRLLLQAGADPNLPEGPNCPRGFALWGAARHGRRAIAELLLAAGADANAEVESSGTPTSAAEDADLRAVLYRFGGRLGLAAHFHQGATDIIAALLDAQPAMFDAAAAELGFTHCVASGHEGLLRGCCWSTAWIPTCPTGNRFDRCTTRPAAATSPRRGCFSSLAPIPMRWTRSSVPRRWAGRRAAGSASSFSSCWPAAGLANRRRCRRGLGRRPGRSAAVTTRSPPCWRPRKRDRRLPWRPTSWFLTWGKTGYAARQLCHPFLRPRPAP